jgi:hypothetical protein
MSAMAFGFKFGFQNIYLTHRPQVYRKPIASATRA